jgi:hypothetical protein
VAEVVRAPARARAEAARGLTSAVSSHTITP